MKFEIDDKIMIKFFPEMGEDDSVFTPYLATTDQLEAILQAVKKTQEKLVNRQIQEIQDSKRTVPVKTWWDNNERFIINDIAENITFTGGLETIKNFTINDKTYNLEEIEQNQKIVDELLKEWKGVDYEGGARYEDILCNILTRATGKDIKDL